MIFVSSYFDFVRLRNFLKSENMSFCLLGEYVTKIATSFLSRHYNEHGTEIDFLNCCTPNKIVLCLS